MTIIIKSLPERPNWSIIKEKREYTQKFQTKQLQIDSQGSRETTEHIWWGWRQIY